MDAQSLKAHLTPDNIALIRKTKLTFCLDEKTDEEIFYDLCFCLCTPQTKWKWNVEVQKRLKAIGFYHNGCPQQDLEQIVKGVRFFRIKAERLTLARQNFSIILQKVRGAENSKSKRQWLVEEVKGCGMKVASHFLRNLGYEDLAILDTHIIKFLDMGKPTSNWDYLRMESAFGKIAESYQLTVGELDMFLWKVYSDTPWEEFVV